MWISWTGSAATAVSSSKRWEAASRGKTRCSSAIPNAVKMRWCFRIWRWNWVCIRSSSTSIPSAGNAAVVALDSNCGIDKVEVAEVQKKQAEQNVMLHFDDALIPKNIANAGEKGEDIGHF